MRPSSIFSSRTLRLRGFRPWGLGMALLVFLLFELGYSRRPAAWTLVPNTPTGLVGVIDEIVQKEGLPRIVILGNSRMIDALSPRLLEDELDLPRGSSLNLSIQAARPFDYASFYDRHRKELGATKLLILGLDDNQFSQQMNSAEQRFRFQASLDQRLRFEGEKRLPFVAGFFLRSLDSGGTANSQLRRILRGRTEVTLLPDQRIRWTPPRESGPSRLETEVLDRVIRRDYSSYQPSPSQERYLLDVLRWCAEDGIDVLLVRPPLRDAFIDRAHELEGTKWLETKQVYQRLPGTKLLFERASDASMANEHFIDYGHFSISGSRLFTGEVAREIDRLIPGILPERQREPPISSPNGRARIGS